MKFAHEFKAALVKEGFPIYWVESAVPYSQLKKILKKVSKELQQIGLDPATLALFVPNPESQHERRGSVEGAAYQYIFEGMWFLPMLISFLCMEEVAKLDRKGC
jgi:E3 ubiquitin-protein ligase BAH